MYQFYDTRINEYSPNKDMHFWYGHSILHFPPVLFDAANLSTQQTEVLFYEPPSSTAISQTPEIARPIYKRYRYRYKDKATP